MKDVAQSVNQNVSLVSIGQHLYKLQLYIFYRLWPQGIIVNVTISLQNHRAVAHLKKKNSKCPGPRDKHVKMTVCFVQIFGKKLNFSVELTQQCQRCHP